MYDAAAGRPQGVVVQNVVDAEPHSRLVVGDARAESRRHIRIAEIAAYLAVGIGLGRVVEVAADDDGARYLLGKRAYGTGLLGAHGSCAGQFFQELVFGLGQEVGANLGLMTSLYQGLFLSPTVVSGALKGAIFAANIYEKLGFACVPGAAEDRHDIIQAVTLGSAEAMVAFCKGIQAAAPVDSYVTPEPWAMPGYDSDVIMAAGAFIQGSSIELSADGPIRPPYAVYFQGGLTWYHAKLGILMSLQKLVDAGIVHL